MGVVIEKSIPQDHCLHQDTKKVIFSCGGSTIFVLTFYFVFLLVSFQLK